MRSINMSAGSKNIREIKLGEIDAASLCSLAIILWGYQTNLFIIALPIILILEGRRVIQQRWQLSTGDLKEAGKLCAALLAILFVIIVTVKKSVFIYTLLQWLPVAGIPLLIAQTYGLGTSELIYQQLLAPHPYQTKLQSAKQSGQRNAINLHTVYFGVCIVAGSATDSDHFIFYTGAAILAALLLWPLRPKRTTPLLWLLLFCLSAGLGFAGHRQLAQAQQQLEAQMIAMIGNFASGAVNPDGTATYMGSVGRLKLSNKIAFRVSKDSSEDTGKNTKATFPLLLQEATYNQYELATWRAENSLFSDVPPGEDDGHWILGPAEEQDPTITISTDLERGDGILTLPRGTANITRLPVEEMQRNQYGAVQVNAKGSTAYQVQFQPGVRTTDARPTAADLQIPQTDQAAIDTVLKQLGIDSPTDNSNNTSEREIINKIVAYFQDFQYSLDLLQPESNTAAVSDFLLNTQAGHCEYFASATALLLRGAGIPARYAVGYSAHEYSPLERQYIVRSRDAHAWTLFYLDNRWQILDTTPPDWTAQEREMASPLQAVPDFFAFLGFQFSYWVRRLGDLGLREVLIIVIPLFCYLLWRSIQVFQGQQKNKSKENDLGINSQFLPVGLDSELYQIEAMLKEQGLARSPSESLLQWCDRIQTQQLQMQSDKGSNLTTILNLHYRYRFDPNRISKSERQQLKQLSHQWIEQHQHTEKI